MQITLEWDTRAKAQQAIAILNASKVKPKIVDVKDEDERETPLIMEERW